MAVHRAPRTIKFAVQSLLHDTQNKGKYTFKLKNHTRHSKYTNTNSEVVYPRHAQVVHTEEVLQFWNSLKRVFDEAAVQQWFEKSR